MKEDYKDIFRRHFDLHEEDADTQEILESLKIRRRRRRRIRRTSRQRFVIIIPILLGLGFLVTNLIQNLGQGQSENASQQALDHNDQTNELVYKEEIKDSELGSDHAQGKYSSSVVEKNLTEVKEEKEVIEKEVIKEKEVAQVKEIQQPVEETSLAQEERFASIDSKSSGTVSKQNQDKINDELNKNEPTVLNDNQTKETNAIDAEMAFNKNPQAASKTEKVNAKNSKLGNEFLVDLDILPGLSKKLFTDRNMPVLLMQPSTVENSFDVEESFKPGLNFIAGATYGFLNSDFQDLAGAQNAYSLNRAQTETNLEAMGSEVLLDYQFHHNISVSAGLGYHRINELFQWEYAAIEERVGTYHSETEVGPNGTENYVFSEGSHQVSALTKMKIYNKTQLLTVPVNVNFYKHLGPLNFTIFGGAFANIVLGEEGYILDENNKLLVLGEDLQSKFGLGLKGGLGVGYSISKSIEVYGNLSYAQMNKEQRSLVVNYKTLNTGLAVRFKL